ncbi:MAG TPA: Clp protease N-terminal domain-containing protein, partial [Bryobacteraceae bacterium]
MFDRYTLTARKAVFLARYEASQFGSDMIETEHLLLGILGAGELTLLKPGAADSLESIRSQIAKRHPPGKSISTTVDLPLSKEAQRVLAHASKEAQKLKHNEIGIEHLLLGILLEQKSFAAGLLRGIGATPETLREEAKRCHIVGSEAVTPIEETPPLVDGARSLTQAALTGTLGLLIGREHELDRAIQILSRRTRNNLVLVGEPGVGKTAIVEGLARRIAEGNVPPDLAERQVLSIDASA